MQIESRKIWKLDLDTEWPKEWLLSWEGAACCGVLLSCPIRSQGCWGVRVKDHSGKRLAKDIGGKRQDSTNLI